MDDDWKVCGDGRESPVSWSLLIIRLLHLTNWPWVFPLPVLLLLVGPAVWMSKARPPLGCSEVPLGSCYLVDGRVVSKAPYTARGTEVPCLASEDLPSIKVGYSYRVECRVVEVHRGRGLVFLRVVDPHYRVFCIREPDWTELQVSGHIEGRLSWLGSLYAGSALYPQEKGRGARIPEQDEDDFMMLAWGESVRWRRDRVPNLGKISVNIDPNNPHRRYRVVDGHRTAGACQQLHAFMVSTDQPRPLKIMMHHDAPCYVPERLSERFVRFAITQAGVDPFGLSKEVQELSTAIAQIEASSKDQDRQMAMQQAEGSGPERRPVNPQDQPGRSSNPLPKVRAIYAS